MGGYGRGASWLLNSSRGFGGSSPGLSTGSPAPLVMNVSVPPLCWESVTEPGRRLLSLPASSAGCSVSTETQKFGICDDFI
jgi:hypothetical protein